jgi:hypothetical protein|uniref:Uncharacterized protein n=1 Tax=Sipha flava TaxID=143950 RepID=A0A2S2QCU1_9HEMI
MYTAAAAAAAAAATGGANGSTFDSYSYRLWCLANVWSCSNRKFNAAPVLIIIIIIIRVSPKYETVLHVVHVLVICFKGVFVPKKEKNYYFILLIFPLGVSTTFRERFYVNIHLDFALARSVYDYIVRHNGTA